MKVLKIISEWKKKCDVKRGYKRVEAIVEEDGVVRTKHIDVKK